MGKENRDKTEENVINGKKEKKPKKSNIVLQKALFFIQHAAMTIMVIALLVTAGHSVIRVEGFRTTATFGMYSLDRHGAYEDSEIFNMLFGYALSDVVRQGVVSSQLETEGHFDGKKIIDVTAFNYRDAGLPEQYVTAEYYLEDLLKWNNYGFEWSSTQMTQSQARNFLADKTRVTIVDPTSRYYNTSDANYLKSDIETYTFVSDVSANQLWVDMDDYDGFVDGYPTESTEAGSVDRSILVQSEIIDETTDHDDKTIGRYNVLVNRYKTVENKNVEEYVSDWNLYSDLCKNVQLAAKGLAYNYDEYLLCREYYKPEHSNVRYMIIKTVGENSQVYTNLTDNQDCQSIAEGLMLGNDEELLSDNASDKYIYYSPADMVYRTNTSITEDTVRQVFQGYDYAYPETIKFWMSVDSAYSADDGFRQGMIGYSRYSPFLWQVFAFAAISGILYLVIFFYLTCVTGKDVDEEGRTYIRLNAFDRIPTEGAVLLACGSVILLAWVFIVVKEVGNIRLVRVLPRDIFSLSQLVVDGEWFGIVFAICIFAADFLAMVFFYSLVRRIRSKTLWKNSWLRMLIKRVVQLVLTVYDNGDIVLRTWVPYAAFLLFNFVMLLCAFYFAHESEGFVTVITLILAVAADIFVGNLLYRNAKEQQEIVKGIETIAGGQLDHQVTTEGFHGNNLTLANSVNSIGKGIKEAVEISMKDERMKADLITNVSHDIKTPLTSIINYVDLIKRERVEDEKVQSYIKVLDEKSQRLKQLTDDLVEASKISSGNINLNFEKINLTELMNQTIGEFSEKFEQKRLTAVMNINAQNAVIEADSRRIWRVMENLFNNIYKYAMEGTRVYLSIDSLPDKIGYISVSVKNISALPLNCSPDELTERFIRGDESRTTEGSGLGLSIAKNLTEAQKGTFEIQLDGDLFKVILVFPLALT